MKTKVRTVPPKLDYAGSVNTLNGKQKCNYYIFVSINKDLTKAHVMGYIPSDLFFNTATPLKKGDGDGDKDIDKRKGNKERGDRPVRSGGTASFDCDQDRRGGKPGYDDTKQGKTH